MTTKAINVLFLAMALSSVALSFIFFKQWNPASSEEITETRALIHFHIDKCEIDNGSIYVQGWALVPGVKKLLTSVYAQNKTGSFVRIEKSTQIRKDVSSAFGSGTEYDMSGFLATKKSLRDDKYTGIITLQSKDEKGYQYVAKYKCE